LNAAGLVQLAAAKGIDLKGVAGRSSDTRGIARERRRTRDEREQGIEVVPQTVRGRESRGMRRPDWSAAELGQAAKGLGIVPWSAALYSYAGSKSGYLVLLSELRSEAIRLSRRERWPLHVPDERGRPIFYCEQLAQLVLDEDALKHLFAAAPQLYAIYMGVPAGTWEKHVAGPFRSLRAIYDQWLGRARGVIAQAIREQS
jgi:hypothetical protein